MAVNDLQQSAKDISSALSGTRFVGVTQTAGTGIIGHPAPTTFDEAKPYFVCFNGNAAGSGINIYPSRLQLFVTVISVGGTSSKFTHTLDVGNRVSSAGTPLILANTNMLSSNPTKAIVTVGAVVGTAATTQRRLLGNFTPRQGVIETVGDEYAFVWGATDSVATCASNTAASAQVSSSFKLGQVCIPPQCSLTIVQWKAAQSTGPTMEVYFDYLEATAL